MEADDNQLWASLVETDEAAQIEAELADGEGVDEDVPVPSVLNDAEDSEEEEETFSFVEAGADAPEPVVFNGAEADTESEELTADSRDVAPIVDNSSEADQILTNLGAESDAAKEQSAPAWDANAEGTLSDTEAQEISDADLVAESQGI